MADLPTVNQHAGGVGTDIAPTWSRADQLAAEAGEHPDQAEPETAEPETGLPDD